MLTEKAQHSDEVRRDSKEIQIDKMNLTYTQVCPPIQCEECDVQEKKDLHRYFIHFLVILFGIGSSIGVFGLCSEFPLLVMSAPEGSLLPATEIFVCVLAYVTPAIYTLANKSSPRLQIYNQSPWISGTLILSTVSMGLMAFFHKITIAIRGSGHSIVLICLTFVLATIGGLRNVFHMPYLRNSFEKVYLTSFFIGEGLSGSIPSIVSLIQGVGGHPVCSNNTSSNSTDPPVPIVSPPNFSPRVYFLIICALLASSTCAFWLLEHLRPIILSEKRDAKIHRDSVAEDERISSTKLLDHGTTNETSEMQTVNVTELTTTQSDNSRAKSISKSVRIYLYTLMFIVCFLSNGYLSSIEAFSALPYGNSAYHLAVNLALLASTAVCTFTYWVPSLGVRGITGMLGLAFIISTYVSWLALSSPTPLWHDTTHGVVLLVLTWVFLIAILSYIRLAITAIIWQEPDDEVIYQLGFVNLSGTVCGAVFTFFLVTSTSLFTPYNACQSHG